MFFEIGNTMDIALAQIDIIAGNMQKNAETMIAYIREAKKQRCDVVAFPEMSIGGYLVGDLWTDDQFCKDLMEWNKAIIEETHNITVVWGNVFLDDRMFNGQQLKGEDGRLPRYNAAYAYKNFEPLERRPYQTAGGFQTKPDCLPKGVTFKTNLPTYRFFDDQRYFLSGPEFWKLMLVAQQPFDQRWLWSPFVVSYKDSLQYLGVELCEDLWCADYYNNPTKMLCKQGADAIVNISASPWTYGKNAARNRRVAEVKATCVNTEGDKEQSNAFVPFYYVNACGVQNNGKNFITFDGGSTIYNKDGNVVALADNPYEPGLLKANSEDLPTRKNATWKMFGNRLWGNKIGQKYEAIVRGIKGLGENSGFEPENVVIGLSGGIDSAVSAALFVEAYGDKRVIAVNMPSEYNSEQTKNAAKTIADNLNIAYVEVPIKILNHANIATIKTVQSALLKASQNNGEEQYLFPKTDEVPEIVQENIQAKIRATSILSNLAQSLNGIFPNNGNKVEVALGYATLYGDWGGGVSPLGDLTKAEVYDMARYVNKVWDKTIIPEELLPDELYQFSEDKIKPSAELKKQQVDPIKVGYHCSLLEKILDYRKANIADIAQWWLDGELHNKLSIDLKLMEIYNLYEGSIFIEDLEWFFGKLYSQTFKRVQSVPIIVTSKTAFGYDYRESIMPAKSLLNSRRYNELKNKIIACETYQPKG